MDEGVSDKLAYRVLKSRVDPPPPLIFMPPDLDGRMEPEAFVLLVALPEAVVLGVLGALIQRCGLDADALTVGQHVYVRVDALSALSDGRLVGGIIEVTDADASGAPPPKPN